MINKIVIQIILLMLILISLFIFYNKYLNDKNNSLNQTRSIGNNDVSTDQNQDYPKENLIYNLSYNSSDIENNQYFINSKSGTMSENGIEFSMNNVTFSDSAKCTKSSRSIHASHLSSARPEVPSVFTAVASKLNL